ncbi:N-acetylmuramic acid 6-phosphate etherase [Microlunatus endophyticus]|uniref:N-acetylmuramic acid 6-phosphate etherase n=1 Tax=Microlunatus endophyticus TaxID=1716077 RepID=A0A917S1N3_9ACTN|nr:N-acetylmuramic acid 6-phosphate etherase [Microlunatus endophyticus]GGL48927.1 N-acetylmuramic acid 6-phosphate etherase [Microlunatus endophyticus]
MTQLIGTERPNPDSGALDEMSVQAIVTTMNDADFSVPEAVRRALPQITAAIAAAEPLFTAGGRLIYAGAGTSGRLGVLDAAECPPTFHTDPGRVVGLIAGGPTALVTAVEGAEDDSSRGAADLDAIGVGGRDIVVGLAASGRTPYVLGALDHAREAGALTISLSCNTGAAASAHADWPIEVDTGPEVLTGSTRLKAGSAQKQVLNMISTALMVRSGRTYGNLMVDVQATNAKLRVRATRLVMSIGEVDEPTAVAALESAGYEVKTAIVMVRSDIDAEQARQRLAAAGGRLALAIGLPSSQHPGLLL